MPLHDTVLGTNMTFLDLHHAYRGYPSPWLVSFHFMEEVMIETGRLYQLSYCCLNNISASDFQLA